MLPDAVRFFTWFREKDSCQLLLDTYVFGEFALVSLLFGCYYAIIFVNEGGLVLPSFMKTHWLDDANSYIRQGQGQKMMKAQEKDKTEYVYSDDTGDARIVVYHLFPGVEVAYISIHMEYFDFSLTEKKYRNQYVGIHYCREGRIEQEMDNEFLANCNSKLQ